jgi:hypothetical protein
MEAERQFKESKDIIEIKIGRNLIKEIDKVLSNFPVDSWAPAVPICYKNNGTYVSDEIC